MFKPVNLNDLAKKITLAEGKKVNLSIAQVKEVIKLTLQEVTNLSIYQIAELLRRYRKK